MKNGTMDLTVGKPLRQILFFSIPLVLGTLFQQLYSFADTMMVGRLIGPEALASVGVTYSFQFLTLGFVQGASVGFGILLARSMGSKDPQEFKVCFWNGTWLCIAMGLVMTFAMYFLADPVLRLIQTPEDVFDGASVYARIVFLGIPATIFYNYCAVTLRSAGDSQRPFYFLIFSSCLNILLDYVFIVPMGMGVGGAALATVLSQFVSGLLNCLWIIFRTDLLKGSLGLRGINASHIKELSKVGFPMGFEYSVSAIGAVIMQGSINVLGTAAVAGQTAAEKIRQMFTLPMESVGMGMSTYVGQNDGAKRIDRIKAGIKDGLKIQYTYCVIVWVVIFFGKRFFTYLVLGPDSGEAGELSVQYLTIISALFFIHGSLMIMRNTLQGMGYSVHSVLSGVGELLGRTLGGVLAISTGLGFAGICLANPFAWGFALIYCTIMTFHFLKKREAGLRA